MKREVFVFGRGMYFEAKKRSIEDNYIIKAFIDNNLDFDARDTVAVYKPSELTALPALPILIAVGRKFFIEIIYELLSSGIDEKRIVLLCLFGKPFDAGENILSVHGGGDICTKQYCGYVD